MGTASSTLQHSPLHSCQDDEKTRIQHVSSPAVVKEIGAVFHFKISDQSYVVDLKNGAGKVSTGTPSEEPEVTVQMDSENLLKLFNREIEPMNALSTGVITMKGDLTKALNLEKVMVAAREAGK